MSPLLLGIDGGGTRTRAAIIDETGQLLGFGTGGPTNYDDIGIAATRDNLAQAIAAACRPAGLPQNQFGSVFLGLAGVVSEKDHHIIRQIATDLRLAPDDRIDVDHDCRIALAGGLSGRPGIVLIAGTGSACYGRTADGEDWRSGGWGDTLADEGSGGWLGLQAMRAAVRSYDGRDEPSRLTEDVLEHLELSHMNDIMHRLYHVGLSRKEQATLAPLVFDAARSGDRVAQRLIQEAVDELALSVKAVADRLKMRDGNEVAVVGGLYQAEDVFAKPLRKAITTALPDCRIVEPELSPVMGACLLALKQLQINPGSRLTALYASEALKTDVVDNSRTTIGNAEGRNRHVEAGISSKRGKNA